MRMRKKSSLALVIILAIFLLAACGANGVDENEQEAADTMTNDTEISETETNDDMETADTVTTASIVSEEDAFRNAISADGTWIIATLNDLTFEDDLVVEGIFYNGGDSENDMYRKIAPYTQDDDRNVTDRFTISAPQMTINSPNTRFQAGVFEGDIIVEADGFSLTDATVEGNIYFASEDYQNSADISADSEVTGDIELRN